jgi:hypothetical protein
MSQTTILSVTIKIITQSILLKNKVCIEQELQKPVSHVALHDICYHPLDAPLQHIYQMMHKHHDNL